MQNILFIVFAFMICGCQWIAMHPQEDAEAVGLIEEGIKDIYEYETRTLSPGQPPMKTGAKGP